MYVCDSALRVTVIDQNSDHAEADMYLGCIEDEKTSIYVDVKSFRFSILLSFTTAYARRRAIFVGA